MVYRIDEYRPDEAQLFKPLFEAVWPTHPRREDTIRWAFQHTRSYEGLLLGAHLRDDRENLIGARGSIPWPLSVADAPEAVIHQFHATCVHPSYRRQGVFSELNTEFLRRFQSRGGTAVFNVSVDASRAGYEKLGWNYIPGLRRLLYLPSLAGLLKGALTKGGRIRSTSQPIIDGADDIPDWTRLEPLNRERERAFTQTHHTRYTPEFFRWRYSRQNAGYRYVLDENAGWCSYRLFQRAGHLEVTIGDVWLHASKRKNLASLLRQIRSRHRSPIISVLVSRGHPYRRLLLQSGFVPDPKGDLNLGVRIVDPLARSLEDPDRWAIMTADVDTF